MKASLRLRHLATGLALMVTASAAQADFIDSWLNGFYYEAGAGSRRGLGVHYIPTGLERGVLFIAFYTFDEATGEPFWITGNATVEAGDFSAEIPLALVEGGSFGAVIGNPQTTDPDWGTATFTVNSCNSIDFSWTSDNVTDGALEETWLGLVAGAPNGQCAYHEPFSGCPAFASAGPDPRTCVIEGGEYTQDLLLTNNTLWILNGAVYVGERDNAQNSNTVTIEPGTRILGVPSSLFGIQRGARILADGLAHAPIVFTGLNTASNPVQPGAPADWGGLTINGIAPLNTCDAPGECVSQGEGESGEYGGDDPHDSSGVLRYVRVQFAGFRFNDENELNGIAFQGVGDGTVVENIQVHANEDDGVEFFGGTVNARNLVLTDNKDDSLDWTEGWRGRLQNVLVVQNQDFDLPDVADQGIEADSLEGDNDAEPRAKPWIANATFIGRPETRGAIIRRGTGVNFTNVIFTGFDRCIDIDDPATFTAAGTPDSLSGNLTIQNSIFDCTDSFEEENGDGWSIADWFAADGSNMEVAAGLDGVFPSPGADFTEGFPIDYEIFDAFFQNQEFIGAFSGRNGDWTAHWTLQNFGQQ